MNDVIEALSLFSDGSFWRVIGLWTAGMFSVLKAFDFVDGRISKAAKVDAARFLEGVDVGAPFNGLSRLFHQSFEAVFGLSHFTWRSYFTSVLASIVTTTLLALVLLSPGDQDESVSLALLSIELPSTILVFALLPDFVSLGKSRWLMRRMDVAASVPRIIGLALVDVVLSALIAVVWLRVSFLVIGKIPDWFPNAFDITSGNDWTDWIAVTLFVGFEWAPLAALGTLLTSIWAVVFASSFILIRTALAVKRVATFTRYFLDFENKPFGSTAMVMVSAATLAFIVVL